MWRRSGSCGGAVAHVEAQWLMWRRSGSAVECQTLDRDNAVTNPLHTFAPLMAVLRHDNMQSLYHCTCTLQ